MFLSSMLVCISLTVPVCTNNVNNILLLKAKARIESIRSAIDVEKRYLWQSSNITTSFNEVCAAQLQGFTLRMAQREAVQKKAEEAIAW